MGAETGTKVTDDVNGSPEPMRRHTRKPLRGYGDSSQADRGHRESSFFGGAASIWCLGAWGWVMEVNDVDSVEDQACRVAFGDFYRLELDAQVRRAVLLLGSNDIANDVVHDAFIAVYRRWDTLDDPGPYLHIAVLNGCRGIHRQRARQRRLLPRLIDRASPPPVDEILDDLLAELPFKQRAAVVLRFYCGLTTDEIARELGCAPGSVGPWLNRALTKLRKALP